MTSERHKTASIAVMQFQRDFSSLILRELRRMTVLFDGLGSPRPDADAITIILSTAMVQLIGTIDRQPDDLQEIIRKMTTSLNDARRDGGGLVVRTEDDIQSIAKSEIAKMTS